MSFYVSLLATASARFHSAAGSIPAFYAQGSSGSFTLQFTSRVSPEERLAVADRLAAAAAEWRDSLAAQMEQEHTTAKELAEARAEIARLKGEQDGGAA